MSGTTWHVRDDPGLQPERTELAWQRTMLSFLAAALLLMRWVDHLGALVLTMVSLTWVVSAYLLIRTRRRTQHVAPTFPEAPVPVAVHEVMVLTGATFVLGALGLAVVLSVPL